MYFGGFNSDCPFQFTKIMFAINTQFQLGRNLAEATNWVQKHLEVASLSMCLSCLIPSAVDCLIVQVPSGNLT